jgi:integrase
MRDRKKLPPSCAKEKQRGVFYRPYLGRIEGKRKYGPRLYLCPYDSPLSLIWRKYEDIQLDQTYTVGWLFKTYFASRDFSSLAKKTQQDYTSFANTMMMQQVDQGKEFRAVTLKHVNERTIRQYLDWYEFKVSGNRQVAVLSSAWTWAVQRHTIPANPCINVKPNKEQARTRYITANELTEAIDLASPWLSVAIELAYLCRARAGEVYALQRKHCTPDGLLIKRTKGSASEITAYTERLVAVLDRAEALDGKGDYLIRNAKGRITNSAHKSAMARLKAKMSSPFNFHDIKAKGITDMSQVQDAWAGHKSGKMLDVYIRQPKIVTTLY